MIYPIIMITLGMCMLLSCVFMPILRKKELTCFENALWMFYCVLFTIWILICIHVWIWIIRLTFGF